MRALLLLILLLSLSERANAISFDFGMSSSITVVANQLTSLPATFVNTDNVNLSFAGLDFGAGVIAGPGVEGLNALNFSFGNLVSQFSGIILQPNEAFQFTFGTISFDPNNPLGNPFGTILHPRFQFRIEQSFAIIPTTISIGDQANFSALSFVSSFKLNDVPEPSPIILVAIGLAVFAFPRLALPKRTHT